MWLHILCPLTVLMATVVFASVLQIDQNLKNIKLIESKFIPDVNVLPADETINSNDENWQQVRRFMEDGLPVLELYGYKPQRGEFSFDSIEIFVKTIFFLLFRNSTTYQQSAMNRFFVTHKYSCNVEYE